MFRFKVVETFLASGTPLARLQYFRPLLEEFGDKSLTDASHMASYIPRVEEREIAVLKHEINANEFMGISFDGTSRLGEAINVVGRMCSPDYRVVMRLLSFQTAKAHLNATQFASFLTRIICTDLALPPENIVCLSRDSVLVNGATCRMLTAAPFSAAENQMCMSHTLNNVGSRIKFVVLSEFMTSWLELVGGRNPHRGAQSLWRRAVAPQRVPGYSKVRWHSLAEIEVVIAENFNKLDEFMAELDERAIGDATREKLHAVLNNTAKRSALKRQLAVMRDLQCLVRTTYELEGDRLELLLVYHRIEALRALGRAIRAGDSVLLNLDGVIRAGVTIVPGVKISKYFEGYGNCVASVRSSAQVNSTLYPGQERLAYKVVYEQDGVAEELEEEEIRPLLIIKDMPERTEIINVLNVAFDYLEDRINGTCAVSQYSCAHMYSVCRVSQILNPAFAAQHLSENMVDDLFHIVRPLAVHVDLARLKAELPAYLCAARTVEAIDVSDVDAFTEQVLKFWRNAPEAELREWRKTARIVFAMSPNSAACERVFSLLENMYGLQRERALADQLQAALMLRYNGRDGYRA